MSSPDLCKEFQKHTVFSFVNHLKNNSCTHCQREIRNIRLNSRAKLAAKSFLWFLIGAVGSPFVLYLVATFWPLWPASHVAVFTSGLRPLAGNAVGCLVYLVSISTDRGFDEAYLKMRFPMKVSDVKVGTASTDALSSENSVTMATAEVGKDANGECKIVQTAGTDASEVATKFIGSSVVIRTAKAQPQTRLYGSVVGSDERAPEKPELPVVHEGQFSTSLLGYLAKRAIQFQDGSVTNAK
jgi:hypothetical protein